MFRQALGTLLSGVVCAGAVAQPTDLKTVAEQSGFQATATHAQVMELCERIADRSELIKFTTMGTTLEGRQQPLLIISRDGISRAGFKRGLSLSGDKKRFKRNNSPPHGEPPFETGSSALPEQRLRVFAMGNIHAGEVCGKEALLALAREFAEGEHTEVLDSSIIILAPIYNADGNERFSTTNRPGQAGPADGMGQRPNAQGLDLNRDHIKLESPEARNLAKLCCDWDPHVLIDCHTTNGSVHDYTITYDGPRNPATPQAIIEFARDELLPTVSERMEAATGYRSFYYGNFSRDGATWESYPDLPRYSTHYFGLRCRIGILSEAYSYAPYKDRVLATKAFVRECIRYAHENAHRIRELTQSDPPDELATRSQMVPLGKFVVSGNATINPYDTDGDLADVATQDYTVVYVGGSKATVTVTTPAAYVFPPTLTRVAKNLIAHGVQLQQLEHPAELEVTAYQVDEANAALRSFQGHKNVVLKVSSATDQRAVPAGWYVARTDQPLGRLLMYLLEPTAADGLASWNYFDGSMSLGSEYPVLRVSALDDVALSPAIVGDTPAIQFTMQNGGVSASLRGLCVVDDKVAWASGADGTVIRTEDQGATWRVVPVTEAPECDFRDISAFSAQEAVIISAGSPARVYSTDDGGQTWMLRYENDDERVFFDAMSFWDRQHGLGFSDPIDGRLFLIRTRDGGRSWQELPVDARPEVLAGEAGFAASGTCLITLPDNRALIGLGGSTRAGTARVMTSTDRGDSWHATTTALPANEASGIFSLTMCGRSHGVAVGGNYRSPHEDSGTILVTRDGGESWRIPFGQRPSGYRSCVTKVNWTGPPALIAVGTNGCDVSTDLGDEWRRVSEESFHTIAGDGSGAGWAVGADGRVARWAVVGKMTK